MSKYHIVVMSMPPFRPKRRTVACIGAAFFINGEFVDKFEETNYGLFLTNGVFPQCHTDIPDDIEKDPYREFHTDEF